MVVPGLTCTLWLRLGGFPSALRRGLLLRGLLWVPTTGTQPAPAPTGGLGYKPPLHGVFTPNIAKMALKIQE